MQIVFVHGFLGSGLNWGRVTSGLRARISTPLEFKTVDLLGHSRGARFAPSADEGPSSHAKALNEDFFKQLPDGRFLPLAHSFGLRPVLDFVSLHPDRCPAIIVEDSLPDLSEVGYRLLTGILSQTPKQFPDRVAAKSYFESRYGEGQLARFLLSNVGQNESGGLGWRFQADYLERLLDEARARPLWSLWENYPGKIHLIVGDRSDVVDQERLKKAQSLRPTSSLLETYVINQSGHWVHSDQLDQFVDCLVRIISSTSSF